jgi:hypothetical protein
MSTSVDHYQEAERLLSRFDALSPSSADEQGPLLLQTAQVHATLALAAVTALNDSEGGKPTADHRRWVEIASVEAPMPPETDDEDAEPQDAETPIGLGARVEILYPPRGRPEITNATMYKGCEGVVTMPDTGGYEHGCWFVRLDRVPEQFPSWVGREITFRERELRVVADVPAPKGATQGALGVPDEADGA